MPAKKSGAEKQVEPFVVRFPVRRRVEHILLIVTFIALSVTGLVQRFYTGGFSEWVIMGLGGIEATRLVHRIFGLIFTLGIVYHFVCIIHSAYIRKQKPSMMPVFQDFRDVINEIKRGLGLPAPHPQFGRYNYRQKFEYIGLMFGSVVLILSGLVLVFPILVTRLAPGELVAVAVIFHGYEATLAVLTILIWHLYEVILKPEVFPADTSIFTGRIPRKRMKEEHYLEYVEVMGQKTPEEPA